MLKNPIPRSIWLQEGDEPFVQIIDQRFLPHENRTNDLKSTLDCERAIKEMEVRGAPLIGITAAFGMYFAALESLRHDDGETCLQKKAAALRASRPTAVNLMWAVDQQMALAKAHGFNQQLPEALWNNAKMLMEEDAEVCRKIGTYGLELIKEIAAKKPGEPVNILTHCNAGSLAVIEWGTATAPIYQAHLQGIKVHVWVDETRPRNQGANLTAYELGVAKVPHTLVVDNAGGHLMQHGMVDLCFVGCDRVTKNGDVANKIGTYLKALAANDNQVPFYVCLPSSTIDWQISDGLSEIEIEERSDEEVRYIQGLHDGEVKQVLICPETTAGYNIGFDVTPARLVTGLVTERGICQASAAGLASIFPDK
ncbi:S-methyl-5-thioribose-1-phosphate isomerase [bacterium]|nr:S-methyl-5-thioribose-1-phosphate isomerase [bacterium]